MLDLRVGDHEAVGAEASLQTCCKLDPPGGIVTQRRTLFRMDTTAPPTDEAVDAASRMSFPASDPPSSGQPTISDSEPMADDEENQAETNPSLDQGRRSANAGTSTADTGA